jgi:hypothetical protein
MRLFTPFSYLWYSICNLQSYWRHVGTDSLTPPMSRAANIRTFAHPSYQYTDTYLIDQGQSRQHLLSPIIITHHKRVHPSYSCCHQAWLKEPRFVFLRWIIPLHRSRCRDTWLAPFQAPTSGWQNNKSIGSCRFRFHYREAIRSLWAPSLRGSASAWS